MAVGTVTTQKVGVIGNLKYAMIDVVGSASYTGSGGDALDLYTIGGFSALNFVWSWIVSPSPVVNATTVIYDRTAKKLQCFGTAANVKGETETTNGTDLSANTFRLMVVGHG